MKKIGITFNAPENAVSMFSSGARQHALYFAQTLKYIGYDVYLIVDNSSVTKLNNLYGFDDYRFDLISNLTDSNFDLVIQFGFEIFDELLLKLREKKIKVVSYNCGNEYMFDSEEALFGNSDKKNQISRITERVFDQIWTLPHHSRHNRYYWETLYRTECVEVPFLWSPLAIEQYESDHIKSGLGDLRYKNRGVVKKLAIFEPNLNLVKWCFPALLVCENAYRLNNGLISHVYITNISDNKRFNLKFFNNIVSSLDLRKDKKISIEARYNTLHFMSHHSDVAVSHSLDNPLNYLYFDLCWMGWPLLHNSPMVKDFGYYYDDMNFIEGGEVLNRLLKGHDINAENYLESNRKAIDRFLPTNKKLQSKYKGLINNLLNL